MVSVLCAECAGKEATGDCASCPYRKLSASGAQTCVAESACAVRQQVSPGTYVCVASCGASYGT